MSLRSFVGICFASVRRLLRSRRCKQGDTLFISSFSRWPPPMKLASSIEGLLSTPCGWVSLYLWLSLPKHTLSGDGTVNRFVNSLLRSRCCFLRFIYYFANLMLFNSLYCLTTLMLFYSFYLLFNDFDVVLFVLFVV